MLYEEAELERIVAAAMESEDCRSMIELIRAEAEGATATTEPQSLKDKQKAKEITEPEDIVNEVMRRTQIIPLLRKIPESTK